MIVETFDKKTVKISIVMSVYNGERYLREAMDSILNQTFTDFEFIIIDDGSIDKSAVIIQSYADERIRFFKQKNAGLAEALNKGIALARGKYVARMDADDIALSDRLMIQFNYMNNHPDVDILGGQAYIIDEYGKHCGEKRKPTDALVIAKAIEYACPVNHPTYMVKANVYRELKGYRAVFLAGQDYDFLLRAHDAGKVIRNAEEYLLYYRVNMSIPRSCRARYQIFVTRKALQLHKQRHKYGSEKANTMTQITNYPMKVSARFFLANKWRNILMMKAHQNRGFLSQLMMMAVVLVSLFDYELFCSSLRGWLYKRVSCER